MRTPGLLLCLLFAVRAFPQPATPSQASTADPGQRQYDNNCSVCHGGDGAGGELAPSIVFRLASRTDAELAELIKTGIPNRGMPAFNLGNQEMNDLVAFLRTLRPPRRGPAPVRKKVPTTGGQTMEGLVLGESSLDLALRTDDQRIHLFRTGAGGRYRVVTSQTDWSTYNGQVGGNRYTTLTQITPANVAKLAPRWIFTMPNVPRLETTPVVVDGIMYVTSGNECYALDAGNGRELWHFQRPRTKGLVGNAAGGEQGVRGFLAAFDQATGKEVWRFWTVPAPGEPGSETWKGKAIEHPSAVTWLTGTYDPQLDTLYWPTGNPGPDYNDDERGGDNLHSDCMLALDAKTGKLKWYYQFTPHDVWDWDATETPMLVDANWQGQPRKLLIQANRNGFFYVFDRVNGKLLLAKPFVKNLNWATGIGPDGRPMLKPDLELPNARGAKVCPMQDGATNWNSTSYDPATGLFFVQAQEGCSIVTKRPVEWEAGRGYLGGNARTATDETRQKVLRAIDIQTGKSAWELPQVGRGDSYGGTLSTASGLVIFCEDSGMLEAVDAAHGKPLWQFQTNQIWRASPMTYQFDGEQYVAAASGQNIIAFGLVK